MALSYVTYAGSGGTNYSVPFGYIAQADVSVYVDGVLQVEGAGNDYTWFNSTTIQFTAGSTPGVGAVVLIRRNTTDTARLVDFQDAGNLTEADLDLNSDQVFYLAQEGIDNYNDLSMKLNASNQWDAETYRIINVGDPVAAQDAVTKNYLDVTWTAYMDASVAAAAASEAAAAASAAAALASETAAAASYDSFDDRYLGPKASDPTLDNDGDPLLTGALYFNTTSGNMMVYNGSAWLAIEMWPTISANALKHLRVNAGGTATEWFDLFGTANTFTAQQTINANGGSMYISQAYDVSHDSAFQGFQTRDSTGTARGFVGSIPADGSSYITMYTWDTTLGTPAWNRVFGAAPNAGDLELGVTNITWEGKVLANLTDAQTFVGALTLSANPTVSKTSPTVDLWDTGVTDKNYRIGTVSGTFSVQERNDGDTAGTTPFSIESGAPGLTLAASGILSNSATMYRGADTSYFSLAGGSSALSSNGAYIALYGVSHASYPGRLYLVPGSGGEVWMYNNSTALVLETVTGGVQVNGNSIVKGTSGAANFICNSVTNATPSVYLQENSNNKLLIYHDWSSHNGVIRKYLDGTPGTAACQIILYDNGGISLNDAVTSKTFVVGAAGRYYDLNGEEQMTFAGRVASTGTAYRLPTSWSSARVSAGLYRVTHNLGSSAYTVLAGIDGATSAVRIGNCTRYTNYFDVYVYGYNNTTATDANIQFTLRMD